MSKTQKEAPQNNPSAKTPHKNQSKNHQLNLSESEKYLLYLVLSDLQTNMHQFKDPEPVNYYFYNIVIIIA